MVFERLYSAEFLHDHPWYGFLLGIALAQKITKLGEGKLSLAKDLNNVGSIVLEDYYAVR